jgi:Fe(3+) dicitrate transport protein
MPWKASLTYYDNEFERSWYRVNNVAGVGLSAIVEDPVTYADQLSWLKGATSPDDALRARDNNRSYGSKGLQGRGEYDFDAGGAAVKLKAGFRFHEDFEDRFQKEDRYRMEDNNMVLTTAGIPGAQDNRVGEADVSFGFLAADIDVGALRLSPGVRYEHIEMKRSDYSRTVPDRSEGPTQVRESKATEWISGIGATYALTERVKLIGGVHEGFNPASPGSTASAETSTNWEFGVRYEGVALLRRGDRLHHRLRQPGRHRDGIHRRRRRDRRPVRGRRGRGARHRAARRNRAVGIRRRLARAGAAGVDLDARRRVRQQLRQRLRSLGRGRSRLSHAVPARACRAAQARPGGRPAGAEPQLRLPVRDAHKAGSGAIPANERTDAAFVVDLGRSYRLTEHFSLLARVQNLLDEEYIASRSPNGVRPGLDRMAMGVQASF